MKKYSDDILLLSEFLHRQTEIYIFIKENKGTMNKYCNKEENYFNDNGTGLLKKGEYKILLTILSDYIKIDDYIHPQSPKYIY